MGLSEYRRKRDFRATAEPRGSKPKKHKRLIYVVQKHAASRLHYDFRLEWDGVLKSWAVPKGPSLDPATKRLAMQVEDHPLEYGDFEGVIPQGEYGGGTVMVWDKGTWEPVEDAEQGFREGKLKFDLHGKKLKGRWMLVRRGGKRATPDERHWFLFKEKDGFADSSVDITETMPLSVTSKRDLDKIARQAKRVWHTDSAASNAAKKQTPSGKRAKKRSQADPAKLKQQLDRIGQKRASMPKTIDVELATLAQSPPEGDEWLHEIKFDGYRMLCRIADGKALFISRNGKDWTSKFLSLARGAKKLPVTDAILDGEVVVLERDGTTSFQALQNAFQTNGGAPFLYYAFDLLFLNGHDIRQAPIETRKELLSQLIVEADRESIRYSDHVLGNGPQVFAEATRLHLEGIISKRSGRPYVAGRGLDWLKIKCSLREEFVIGGFTKPEGTRSHFGALLLGYYDRRQQLKYAGRVGTGFGESTLFALRKKFTPLIRRSSPFVDLAGTTGQARGVTWLEPKLVAQVEFSNWTQDRQLRHPSYQGLREDKPANDVVRDDPIPLTAIRSASKAAAMSKTKSAMKRATHPSQNGKSDAPTTISGVRLTHPDKVLYPQDDVTKLDLAHYYEHIADWMLPHLENRLLSLVRCPSGIDHQCFFQKHPAKGTSDRFRRFKIREKNETEEYITVDDLQGLLELVQISVLEIHVWGSRADEFEKPDRLIFDLDPDPAVEWPQVVAAAKEVRLLLEDLGLASFVKTTGGKGLHVVVPVRRRLEWPETKAFCRSVAEFLVAAAPDRYIATMSKAARTSKIFVDYLRNDRGATSIAAYSTRAKRGAPVSVPLSWDELSGRIHSDHFNIHNLPARLAKLKKDPWAEIDDVRQSITAAMIKKL
jgi:bifunctional non-homologous end joining protein LigD